MTTREHLRIDQRISIVIDYFIKDAETDSYKPALLMCEGLDVSSGGLKIHLDRELPMSAIYQVSLKTLSHEFRLAVQVKWRKPVTETTDQFAFGLQILESHETDIVAWKQWVADQFDQGDLDLNF